MALADYGITSIATATTSKLTKRKKVEPGTPRRHLNGTFAGNVTKKLHWLINAEGTGPLPADFALAGGGPEVVGISGGVTIVEQVEETQTNDGEPSKWTASAVNAPGAS